MTDTDTNGNNEIKLFEKQKKIYPKRVWGRYRIVKWAMMFITLAIYYLAPFLRYDRGAHVPDQAILIDVVGRRAYFFFIEIWPQEVYYLTGILILAAIALFFATSMFGRVWCGYTCPQTVWTDLFVWVERIVQGDRVKRMRLDKSKLSFEKIWKKTVTHSIWLFIGMCTGGAWVFYFNDAPTLLEHIIEGDIPSAIAGWVIALTFSTYLMAGYARDQVCTFMCPYARFQSAMFDKDSLIIGYDENRGETRGKKKKNESWDERGHCVDCTACVVVCPMGIDIRDGLQMECIACGMCVDACNNIMDKLELPRGLIRYDTAHNFAEPDSDKITWKFFLRPRTFYYLGVLGLVSALMLYSLMNRAEVELHVLHDRNPLFVTLSDGTIRNGYDIKILNKLHEDVHYSLKAEGLDGMKMRVQGMVDVTKNDMTVFADAVGQFRVFISAPKPLEKRAEVRFTLKANDKPLTDQYDSVFISEK